MRFISYADLNNLKKTQTRFIGSCYTSMNMMNPVSHSDNKSWKLSLNVHADGETTMKTIPTNPSPHGFIGTGQWTF